MATRVLPSIRCCVRAVRCAALALFVSAAPAPGAECALGVGIAGVSLDAAGVGTQLRLRTEDSHWYFGWEYGTSAPYTYDDPYTGLPLTRTSEFMTGPFVHHRFRARTRSSWYLGAALLHWSRTETSLVFGDSSTSSTTDPYIGGGFVSLLTKHLLFNGGLLIGPTADLNYATSASSFESGGNLDVQLMLAIVF